MQDAQKELILNSLKDFIKQIGSQPKAASALGVSSATVTNFIKEGNRHKIGDGMWRKLAAGLSSGRAQWQLVETRDFKEVHTLLNYCQQEAAVVAITGEAGTGKSAAIDSYVRQVPNAYRLQCAEFWNKKFFLQELLRVMGKPYSGLNIPEMVREATDLLSKQNAPLLVLDEADKLPDATLYFFITLYNQLEDVCGIALCATDHLKKRVLRGLKLNRKGFKEIYSRCNRNFIALEGPCADDVVAICTTNGVADKEIIKKIWEDCQGDFRRVKQKVKAFLKDQIQEAA